MNLIQVAEGYLNLAKKGFNISNATVEELSKKRMVICKACPSFDKTEANCLSSVFKGCCNKCGCYMEAATRAIDKKCSDKENPKW